MIWGTIIFGNTQISKKPAPQLPHAPLHPYELRGFFATPFHSPHAVQQTGMTMTAQLHHARSDKPRVGFSLVLKKRYSPEKWMVVSDDPFLLGPGNFF